MDITPVKAMANVIASALSRGRDASRGVYILIVIVLQVILGFFASMIVMWFSRRREFRADAGAARLAGANRMVAALERLKAGSDQPLPGQLNAFGISGGVKGGLAALFASHPPLDERIARLKAIGG